MARDWARGLIKPGIERSIMGPTGIPFRGTVISQETGNSAVRVRVAGTSAYSGTAIFDIYPDDPLGLGFNLPESYGALRKGAVIG